MSVVLAVLTYRRPEDLATVVPLLLAQLDEAAPGGSVLVVDNDPEGGARAAVQAFPDPRVRYAHEPSPGIAAARNRALDAAEADVLVFIDDDERPSPGWLAALLRVHAEHGSQGVVGPVVSEFTGELDPWIEAGGFFTRRRLPTGTAVEVAATNNLLLDLAWVRGRGLRFDPRLGLTGGSDTLFTRQLTAAGGRLVWCAEAMVTDVVPAERMTRSWVLRRAYRMGNSASLVAVRVAPSRPAAAARQVALGLSRVLGGAARAAAGALLRSRRHEAAGCRNVARGLGLLAGTLGVAYAEYRR